MKNQIDAAIQVENLSKNYKGFKLSIPRMEIAKGFATALIGENGAGKSTLINILTGIRRDYKGSITYFENSQKTAHKPEGKVQELIGYTGPGCYFLPHWTIRQVEEISKLLFPDFHEERFRSICSDLGIDRGLTKDVKKLSDGNRMKLMLAAVLARDTELLILDEPASPLDPLMRDRLCDMIREYLEQGKGERSVFFSTHNIADMENVTDYAIILEHGTIVEEGFVEDLKEKYVCIKGEAKEAEKAGRWLYSVTRNSFGFEGICLAENLNRLAGMDIVAETPTLSQICVAVMKENTHIKPGRAS